MLGADAQYLIDVYFMVWWMGMSMALHFSMVLRHKLWAMALPWLGLGVKVRNL